jgi:hypothetical protein
VRHARNDRDPLNLAVWITAEGIVVMAGRGRIAPGCTDVGSGVTIPKVSGHHDLANLTACAERLNKAQPWYERETAATLLAGPSIDLGTVLSVMDALRAGRDRDLFPEVRFAVHATARARGRS